MRVLPPWTRAPLLGLRRPAAVLAVLVTTAILACAVASAPLFLSSARSAALQEQLAPQCAEAAWPAIGILARAPVEAQAAVAVADAPRAGWASIGQDAVPALHLGSSLGPGGNPQTGVPVAGPGGERLSQPAQVFWRPGAVDHVQVVAEAGGPGVWLPASYAEAARAVAGDTITVGDAPLAVAGVYTDLFDTEPGAYWCDHADLFTNAASADTPPPALLLATDPQTVVDLTAAVGGSLRATAAVPEDGSRLTASRAEELAAQTATALAAATAAVGTGAGGSDPRLADARDRAVQLEQGLRGPVVPVAVAGGLLALVLVAAAGSAWADRRATEVRLLAARGVGPVPLAGKAALELGAPALVGAALGWAAARLLVGALGPAPELDPAATSAAVVVGAAAFVVGLGAAALVAGLRARGMAERPLGAAPSWPARVPWEVALLLAAAVCWLLLEGRDAVVSQGGVAQVNGLLVAFPLLGLAGAAVLLARLLTAALPRVRRWAGGRGAPVFLAVNRLTAARGAAAVLLVAVALPVAVLGYTATLTAGSAATLTAKVGVQLGAGGFAATATRVDPDAVRGGPGTTVTRYADSTLTGADGDHVAVQTLGIDPATFAGTAFWVDSFADRPLEDLVTALTREGGVVPVVAAGLPPGPYRLDLGSLPVDVEVVATADVLPGRRSADPVVLVARDRVPEVPPTAGADQSVERWTDGDVAVAAQALRDAGAVRVTVTVPDDVRRTANFLGITWTFGYLAALAVFIGVIGAAGLLLHLEARSRSRVAGYVMTRRIGLTRGAHLRSLLVELVGVAGAGVVLGGALAVGAVAAVHRRLDVDLLRPPTPLLQVPWPALAATVLVALAVAALAALHGQRAADRADPASVLRDQ